LRGKSSLTGKTWLQLARTFPEQTLYLLTGRRQEPSEPRIIYFEAEDPEIREEFERTERKDAFVPIRILSDPAAMGPGRNVASGATDGYAVIYDVALPRIAKRQTRRDEKIVCLWAMGDSMEPTIQKRALVAVDLRANTIESVENRKIYAMWLPEGGITLKRVIRSDSHLILIADNPEAEGYPRVLTGEDAERAVRGKVIWWWSRQE